VSGYGRRNVQATRGRSVGTAVVVSGFSRTCTIAPLVW